ncbi:MAG: N-6 DNA methylase [Candidatus Cloacimonetes bacterium]|nr:N-6 DNA methylase [Candidatus Cloacimonadota bacterium]
MRADVNHLSYNQKTNLGSFYTPSHLVKLVYDTFSKNLKNQFVDVVLEPACGYGAFFTESFPIKSVRFVGADIDRAALSTASQKFPNIQFLAHNLLSKPSRAKYEINENEKLVIVGNPPYNDVTSKVKNKIKSEIYEIDTELRTRDLGLSSLLAFTKLNPEYIAVLHPLSYLIKKANFLILKPLMCRYKLLDAVVFNSQEFSETSKATGFPVVAAIYEKNLYGTRYEQILHWRFKTLEGFQFSLLDFDYVCKYIPKYPSHYLKKSNFKFFTMRDINALKRSRTFITEDSDNTIHIPPEKLMYYCYIDVFKDIIPNLPYFMGNLDVPFDRFTFEETKEDFLTMSIAKHPDIFRGKFPIPESERLKQAHTRVNRYFKEFLGVEL